MLDSSIRLQVAAAGHPAGGWWLLRDAQPVGRYGLRPAALLAGLALLDDLVGRGQPVQVVLQVQPEPTARQAGAPKAEALDSAGSPRQPGQPVP